MTWSVVYLLLWAYRCLYSVAAEVVISRLTSLGDSGRYQDSKIEGSVAGVAAGALDNPREAATVLTETLGASFNVISGGSAVITNIGFQTIAFIGIVALLRATPPQMRMLMILFAALPSFSLWSSVASKEALVVYGVGVLSALIIKLYNRTGTIQPQHLLALVVVALAKNHYLPALGFLFIGTYVAQHVRQRASLVLWVGTLSIAMLFVFESYLGKMAIEVARHFDNMGSSRPPFWITEQDVLVKAPLGMLLAFFGPTLSEVSNGPLQLMTFAESSLLIGILLIILLARLPSMPVYMALMGMFTIFWIMFASYPFGAMNGGSAIRYRTGYQLLIFALIVVVMSRTSYVSWSQAWKSRRTGAETPALPLATHSVAGARSGGTEFPVAGNVRESG